MDACFGAGRSHSPRWTLRGPRQLGDDGGVLKLVPTMPVKVNVQVVESLRVGSVRFGKFMDDIRLSGCGTQPGMLGQTQNFKHRRCVGWE